MTSVARGNGRAHGSNGGTASTDNASSNGGEAAPRSTERGLLMAGNALAPCIGCTLECFPRSCELITAWLGLLELAPRGANDHP